MFFIPSEKRNGLIQPTLSVGWSLNYEMFFYVLFGGLLLVKALVTRVALLSALLAGLVLWGIVDRPHTTVLRFYTEDLVLEFALGDRCRPPSSSRRAEAAPGAGGHGRWWRGLSCWSCRSSSLRAIRIF